MWSLWKFRRLCLSRKALVLRVLEAAIVFFSITLLYELFQYSWIMTPSARQATMHQPEDKLTNASKVMWKTSPKYMCRNEQSELLVVIVSKPGRYAHRQLIRELYSMNVKAGFELHFIIYDERSASTVQEKVDKEARRYDGVVRVERKTAEEFGRFYPLLAWIVEALSQCSSIISSLILNDQTFFDPTAVLELARGIGGNEEDPESLITACTVDINGKNAICSANLPLVIPRRAARTLWDRMRHGERSELYPHSLDQLAKRHRMKILKFDDLFTQKALERRGKTNALFYESRDFLNEWEKFANLTNYKFLGHGGVAI